MGHTSHVDIPRGSMGHQLIGASHGLSLMPCVLGAALEARLAVIITQELVECSLIHGTD